MPPVTFLVALIPFGIANYCWWRATNNLSEKGEQCRVRIYFWTRWLAGRDNFTDVGWRYRTLSIYWAIAMLGVGLAGLVIVSIVGR
jgi:hypothetical protein